MAKSTKDENAKAAAADNKDAEEKANPEVKADDDEQEQEQGPALTALQALCVEHRGEGDFPEVPDEKELSVFIAEQLDGNALVLLDALDHMSIGREFNPALRPIHQLFRTNRNEILEWRKRIQVRKDAQARAEAGEEVEELQRLRYAV